MFRRQERRTCRPPSPPTHIYTHTHSHTQIRAHYFEDGNVQLQTSKTVKPVSLPKSAATVRVQRTCASMRVRLRMCSRMWVYDYCSFFSLISRVVGVCTRHSTHVRALSCMWVCGFLFPDEKPNQTNVAQHLGLYKCALGPCGCVCATI